MLIAAIDENPIKAAKMLPDKHIVKLVTEASMIISLAGRKWGFESRYQIKGYTNHPTVRWARESIDNMMWLCLHAIAIEAEYCRRYGKKSHKGAEVTWNFISQYMYLLKDSNYKEHTEFPLTMPEKYKNKDDRVGSYREYFSREKTWAKWKHGGKPEWWK